MEIAKAEKVASQFEVAKQFWSYQVKQGVLAEPKHSLTQFHIAFVWGDNVKFLEKRYAAMIQSPLFKGMKFTEDPAVIKQWAPLVMTDRDPTQKLQRLVWKLVLT